VMLALISELLVNALLISSRFTVGWYISRFFALATSTIVLAALLQETVVLYGRLARSNTILRRERYNKLMSLEALVAAIKHEIKQPLTAVAMNSQAIELSLEKARPELDEARLAARDLVADSIRMNEILDNIGHLFGRPTTELASIDVNGLLLEALRSLDAQLKAHKVRTHVELSRNPPLVMGQRGQLIEVIVNLVQNAIDEMDKVGETCRELRVKTEIHRDKVKIVIADTGPEIDRNTLDNMFQAFFTTKSNGMGLGLAICRMIIERHGGQLSVSAADPGGAIFEFVLPQIEPAAVAVAPNHPHWLGSGALGHRPAKAS
jgi:signal transduction histidine kinase